MPTKRISYLFIFIFILSILHTKSYSKDDKKEPPPIKLPGVTITGEEKDVQIQHGEKLQIIEEELYDSAKPIPLGKEEKETVFNSPDYKKAFIVEVKEKDKRFMLNISLEGGNYNYYSAEIIHGGQNDNNNYLLDYYYVHDGGERERSLQDKNKIVFDISQKLADEYQVINISGKIVSSLIELPGQLDNPFTNRSRKMEDVFVSGCWEKRKAQDEYLKIGYFWKSQKLEEQDSTTAVPGPGDRSGMGIECNYAFIYENPVRFNLKYSSNEALNKSSANLQQAGLEMDILKLIEDLNIQIGGTYSNYDKIDTDVSSKINLKYKLNNNIIFNTKIFHEFSIPDYAGFYNQNNYTTIDQDQLLPEKAWNYQFGIDSLIFYRTNIIFNVFQKNIKNYLILDDETDGFWKPVSMAEWVKMKGADFNIKIPVSSFLKTSFNYVYTKSETEDKILVVPLVPEHKLNFNLTFLNNWVNIDINGKYSGERYYDKDINNDKLKDYILLGMKIYRDFGDKIYSFVNFENLGRVKYEDVKGYPLKEIRVKGGVAIKF